MSTLVGSLYSGIGGLDWAVEQAFGGRTAWQLDQAGAAVRRRHWPDVLQVEADVTSVDPDDLPRVDILCGGFSCKGMSVAGKSEGLGHPETRATYFGLLVFAGADRAALSWLLGDDPYGADLVVRRRHGWAPEVVCVENTPAMLTKMRGELERHFGLLGYGLTWVRARALDAGHPHRRARVFVLAIRGGHGRGVLDAPRDGEWTPARGERAWATLTASESKGRRVGLERRDDPDMLSEQIRPWPTVTTRDEKSGSGTNRSGPPPLSYEAPQYPSHPFGSRLSVDWTECLMGLPPGWTLPTGPRLEIDPNAPAVRGRYPADWDRSQYWPGWSWEPARTLPDGPPVPGRPARIAAVGNAVAPHEGLLALRTALGATARQLLAAR